MKYKHIVLGKGFMGVAVYNAIQDDDKVLIWDYKPESASKSAAGIVTESWFIASTIRQQYAFKFTLAMIKNGINYLINKNADIALVDELKINEVNTGSKIKVSKDTWLLWNKDEYLDSPKKQIQQKITEIDFNGMVVRCGDEIYEADNLYVCLGINILDFTKAIPLRARLGQALFIKDSDISLCTYYVAPYTHFTVRPWKDGSTRVGDTTAKTHIGYLLKRFGKGEVVSGIRPSPIKEGYIYHKIRNTHVFTSGGRVGLGLSGMVGHYFDDIILGKIRF